MPSNRTALLSLVFAVLTVLSFCIGAAPLPLTAFVCYPAALLLGAAAVWSGFGALRQMEGSQGRWMAWLGIWMGALASLAVLCFTIIALGVLYYGVQTFRTIWPQLIK